jgi:beta-mannosidase
VLVEARHTGTDDTFPAIGFFKPYKHLALPNPGLEYTVDGTTVTITTDAVAVYVRLEFRSIDGWFTDNYFHLAPGETRTIEFRPRSEEMTSAAVERSLGANLTVRSLQDTY